MNRWTEWVAGVTVNHDAPGGRTSRARGRSNAIKWPWEFTDPQVGQVPCCPECDATVPRGRHQARHERWHNQLNDLLEEIVHGLFGIENDDEDGGGGELQLENSEDES